jgi:uncharacterized membrane protein
MKQALKSLRNNFVVGFIAILPLALSIGIFVWLVELVIGVTDKLLVFLPHKLRETEWRPLFSVLAFLVSVTLVTLLGFITRNVVGKSLLHGIETLAMRVPLLNKIHGGVKQLFEAINTSKKGSFQRVVLVQFPHRDSFVIAFVTSESPQKMDEKIARDVINVFVPTTPNPTSGFMLVVPKEDTIPMDMSVADAVKMVISGGAVIPSPPPATPRSDGAS